MAGAKNRVIAGDYQGYAVSKDIFGNVYISKMFGSPIFLDSNVVLRYETIDSDKMKSGSSAIARSAIGGFFLGPLGLLAGVGAKNKNVITVAIEFKDGRKSLIEIDQPIYKALLRKVF